MADGKKKRGRKQQYDPAKLAPSLLEWIAQGETMASWCRQKGHPSARTVEQWKLDDEMFATAYARAREEGGQVIADRLRELASEPCKDNVEVQQRRLQVDVDKWLLARWFPTQFGDRVAVAGDPEAPLRILSDVEAARQVGSLLGGAAARMAEAGGRSSSNGNGNGEG